MFGSEARDQIQKLTDQQNLLILAIKGNVFAGTARWNTGDLCRVDHIDPDSMDVRYWDLRENRIYREGLARFVNSWEQAVCAESDEEVVTILERMDVRRAARLRSEAAKMLKEAADLERKKK